MDFYNVAMVMQKGDLEGIIERSLQNILRKERMLTKYFTLSDIESSRTMRLWLHKKHDY